MNIKKPLYILVAASSLIASSCNYRGLETNPSRADSTELSTQENASIGCDLTPSTLLTEADSVLEKLLQESYYEVYAKYNSQLYGDRLYTNEELLCPDFEPDDVFIDPELRLQQYFLRNGKDATFAAAEQLGVTHHQIKLSKENVFAKLYAKAGMSLEGEILDWVEVPEGRSGGLGRDSNYFGGEDELIMQVKEFTDEIPFWILQDAKEAGYLVDHKQEYQSLIANELSHEIQHNYFGSLFTGYSDERLTAPFTTFTTEVPGLQFRNNLQAGEFLSDVADWVEGGKTGNYYRFFNPLFYMTPGTVAAIDEDDGYAYTVEVQKYAMKEVLEQKGYENPNEIIQSIIAKAENSNYENHHEIYPFVKQYFQEEDFQSIANIYERIGVELLTELKPYFEKK